MAGLSKIKAGALHADCVTSDTFADNSINGDHLSHSTALPDGVTATTQNSGDNSTKVATTAYADAAGTNLDAAVTINESGNSVNFRVESSGNANALLVDGTNNRVGIGCVPGHPFEVAAGPNTHVICVSHTSGNDVIRLTSQDASGDAEIIGFENSASGTHAEKFKINASGQSHFSGGNVGIGTTAPDNLLHIKNDTASADFPFIKLENRITGGSVSNANILFQLENSNTNKPRAMIGAVENGGDGYADLVFKTSPQANDSTLGEKFRIRAGGGVCLNGEVDDAHTLDDYEEGTWVPRMYGWSGSGYINNTNSQSAYTSPGRYRKIGNMVQCWYHYEFTSNGIASGNPWYIRDLPFPVIAQASGTTFVGSGRIGGATNAYSLTPYAAPGNNDYIFNLVRNSASGETNNITHGGGAGWIYGSVCYLTSS